MESKQNLKLTVISKVLSAAIIIGTMMTSNHASAQGKWVAPSSANELKNPVAGDAAALKEGKALYQSYCSPCHGEKGKGDGVAGGALSPKPANHSSALVQNQTDGAIFWKLTEGRGAMASYKAALTEKQRWSLVCFIRTLKK